MGVITAIAAWRITLVRLAREHEGWIGEMPAGTEEQAKGSFLAEGKGRVPVRVACKYFNGLGSIDPFDPRLFSLPRTGRSFACCFKGFFQCGKGGLNPYQ